MRLASAQGAKLVFFPEASDFIGNPPEEALTLASPIGVKEGEGEVERVGEGEFLKGLCQEAKELGIGCSVGVHEQVPFFFVVQEENCDIESVVLRVFSEPPCISN